MNRKVKASLGLIATLSLACASPFSASAAQPVVEWDGDFHETTKGSFTLDANGNTVASDGTSITIASSDSLGVQVSWSEGYDQVTMIVRYSGLEVSSEHGVLGMYHRPDHSNRVGLLLNATGKVQGAFDGATYSDEHDCSVPSAGTLALRYSVPQGDDRGLYAYSKGVDGHWSHLYSESKLVSGGDVDVKYCTVGGPQTASGVVKALPGMAIEAIAVFNGVLTEAEIGAYVFPSDRKEPVPVMVQPDAEWEGDFNETTKGSFTLDANGNTMASDGTSITIGSSDSLGVQVSWPEGCDQVTMIVRYSGVETSVEHGALGMFHRPEYSNRVGLMLNATGKVQGAWDGQAFSDEFDGPVPVAGTLALRYSTPQGDVRGLYAYSKSARGRWWRQLYSNSGLMSGGDADVKYCTVGGPQTASEVVKALPSMVIEAIAVFSGALTEAEIAAYSFPSARKEYATASVASGSYAWAELPWKRALVPPVEGDADASVTLVLAGDVVITDESISLGYRALNVIGTGSLTLPSGSCLAANAAGSVGEGVVLRTADGTMSFDGKWEVLGAVDASAEVSVGEHASVAIFNGSLGRSVVGAGVVRCVGVMPTEALCADFRNGVTWQGNCVLENVVELLPDIDLNNYGSAASKITLKGVTGYFPRMSEYVITQPEIILEDPEVPLADPGTGAAFTMCNGYGRTTAALFRKLSGEGTFVEQNILLSWVAFYVLDGSDFAGSIPLNNTASFFFCGLDYSVLDSQPSGVIDISSGVSVDLAPRSVIHGRQTELDGAIGTLRIGGTLSVTSLKATPGDITMDGGELKFDAEKARSVEDATLTDCSDCDFSAIHGTGTVWFSGSYSPFVLPKNGTHSMPAGFSLRLDAIVRGDLIATRTFGGMGTLEDGTFTIGADAVLDLTWGAPVIAEGASVIPADMKFKVRADPAAIADDGVLLFRGGGDLSALDGASVTLYALDGNRLGRCQVALREGGAYAVVIKSGLAVIVR